MVGSEQGGIRPVLIVQNNVGNKHSHTVIVVPISSVRKKNLIQVRCSELPKNSTVLAEQIRTIDRSRLRKYVGSLNRKLMKKINEILKISIGVDFDD